jgi:tetratricopeptide (TPR) repeat protein
VSIFAETGERSSGTHDPIRLFTNRYGAIRRVATRINEDPPGHEILFLVGLGGNGKTALLQYLRENCCYRMPAREWREISTYADPVFVSSISQAPHTEPVPVAWLDFGSRPSGENRPQEMLPALFTVKRQLAQYKVRTPRFDLAALTYYRKVGLDVAPRMAELFPASELGIAADVVDSLLSLPVLRTGMSIYEAINRRLDDAFSRRRLIRRVPPEESVRILAMPAEPTLADELPALLAKDLHDALRPAGDHDRIVLMFDTYEAFAGEATTDSLSYSAELGGPRWFRLLLGNLPIGNGVVPLVAGRTRPQWHAAVSARIPTRYVDFLPIGPLGADFADTYLAAAGIPGEARPAIIAYASVEPGQVHPYLLGLCADLASVAPGDRIGVPAQAPAPEAMVEKERMLAARLLSWVTRDMEDAIVAVSAARSFDLNVFVRLGEVLGFPCREPDFRRLITFSFVTSVTRVAPSSQSSETEPPSSYEIHRILRKTLTHIEPEKTRAAHEALAAYYDRDETSATSRAEAIYHLNQLDAADGIREWLAEVEDALSLGLFDRCRTLVALLPDMTIEHDDDRRAVTYASARADLGLGRVEDARQRLAALPADSAYGLLLMADIAFVGGRFDESNELAHRALAAAPDGVGRTPFLFRVAELDLFFGFHEESRRLCAEAAALAATGENPRTAANEQTRFWSLSGTVAYFAGDISTARQDFARSRQAQLAIEEPERNLAVTADLFQDDALVAVADENWDAAVDAQTAALAIRRQITDMRGIAHSLHGLGIALAGRGDFGEAERSFTAATETATRIGDELLLAKIARARGEAEFRRGNYDAARAHLATATADFTRIGIDYDVVHARLTSARVDQATGDWEACVAARDEARTVIERRRYFSLYGLFPEARPASARQFAAAAEAASRSWPGVHAALREAVAVLPDMAGQGLPVAAVIVGATVPVSQAGRRVAKIGAMAQAIGAGDGASAAASRLAAAASWAVERLGGPAVLAGLNATADLDELTARDVIAAGGPADLAAALAAYLAAHAAYAGDSGPADAVSTELSRLRASAYLDTGD